MRPIILLATVVALASGLLGALAYGELFGEAGAAPPPPPETPVREQNLDPNGFIRVHEQGVADVNVLSMPPQAAPQGRLIELGTLTAAPEQAVEFPLVKTDDCSQVSAVATTPPILGTIEPGIHITASRLSLDGTTLILWTPSQLINIGNPPTAVVLDPWPFIQLRVQSDEKLVGGHSRDVTAWLWCAP